MKIYIKDVLLADKVKIADNFFLRLRGLLGKKSLNSGEGLLLINCPSIHCLFMKFTIDAVYLSDNMMVLDKETIQPWRIGKRVKGTCHILELSKDKAKALRQGDILIIEK